MADTAAPEETIFVNRLDCGHVNIYAREERMLIENGATRVEEIPLSKLAGEVAAFERDHAHVKDPADSGMAADDLEGIEIGDGAQL